MTKLILMTQSEYEAFLEYLIPDYAADNVRAGYWSEDEALERSRQQTMSLLSDGLNTKNHFLYTLYDDDKAVGMIWMRAELDRPVKSGFIFDVEVVEKYRGRGYGKQAMLLIEEKARELGIKRMGLHVFAYNKVAKSLYENIGYEVSSMNMLKDLE